jgi:cell wall assembly regulator SMI1
MKDTWDRIEHWLVANAPKAYQALNPPASSAAIGGLERTLGTELPKDFKESASIHDGQVVDIGIFGWELLQCARILEKWKLFRYLLEDESQVNVGVAVGPVRPVWVDALWIPFVEDGAGNMLCLDLHPEDSGQRGQIIDFWHDGPTRTVVAPTFADWLTGVADAMEAGGFVLESGWPIRPM